MASGLSKYAEKLAARRRESEGRMFQPLTDKGESVPIPRPLLSGYHPHHECSPHSGNEDAKKWLPDEFKNRRQIEFFRNPYINR